MSEVHYSDCAKKTVEKAYGMYPADTNCRCSLEREREADRAAIRALSHVIDFDVRAMLPSEHVACDAACVHAYCERSNFEALDKALEEHSAAIQRAQDARAGKGK